LYYEKPWRGGADLKSSKQDGEQRDFKAKAPAFTPAPHGYDMRKVDTYVDELRAKNDHLTDINQQLFMLWLAELRELKEKSIVELPQMSADGSVLSWEKIHLLMEQSYRHGELGNVIHPVGPPITVIQQIVEPKKRSRVKSAIMSGFFYLFLAISVMGVYLFGMGSPTGPPRDLAGFSVMTVLTRSMQEDIPQHSLIVTRRVDPETIQIGDDITYLRPNNTTVTHRVIGIRQNYANTGAPGFETQGTANPRPDTEIVLAANVVGLVVFHSLQLGLMIWSIQSNLLLVVLLAALALASLILLRKFVFPVLFQKGDHSDNQG